LKKLLFCTALLCVAVSRALGQGDESKASTPTFVRLGDAGAEAARLLKSNDNKERAWGAYLVGLHGLKDQTASLVSILEDESLSGGGPVEAVVRQAALDSLIRLDAEVPADALLPLYQSSPDEVLILLARSPGKNQQTLLSLFADDLPSARWLAIGNLLAETRAQGFAAHLLAGLKIEATVYVFDREEHDNYGTGGGCGGGCGGGTSWRRDEELPPVGYYMLEDAPRRGATVLATGRRLVSYTRALSRSYGSSGWCGFDRDVVRVEYLAGLLYISDGALGFSAYPSRDIVCKDAAQCGNALAAVRNEIARAYNKLLRRLLDESLLDAAEASELRPDIKLDVTDYRRRKSFPLPEKLHGVTIKIEEPELEPPASDDEPPAAESVEPSP
jgi:hypothetical protein